MSLVCVSTAASSPCSTTQTEYTSVQLTMQLQHTKSQECEHDSLTLKPSSISASQACHKTSLPPKCLWYCHHVRRASGKHHIQSLLVPGQTQKWHHKIHLWVMVVLTFSITNRQQLTANHAAFILGVVEQGCIKLDSDSLLYLGLSRSLFAQRSALQLVSIACQSSPKLN